VAASTCLPSRRPKVRKFGLPPGLLEAASEDVVRLPETQDLVIHGGQIDLRDGGLPDRWHPANSNHRPRVQTRSFTSASGHSPDAGFATIKRILA
jgi:hypothetical protein